MTNRIIPPKHLSKPAQDIFRETVKLMRELKVYHSSGADNSLIERYAWLVAQVRSLDAGVNTAEDQLKVIATIGSLTDKISRIGTKLGLSRDARPEHARSQGRPRKHAQHTPSDEDEKFWENVFNFDDEKEARK